MVKEILLKHLKVIAISTVFIAVGNSYAFHPDKALAKNNDSNSSTSEITTVSNTVSDKTRQKVLEDAKVEEVMDALEKERPIVEGATIIKYNYWIYVKFLDTQKLSFVLRNFHELFTSHPK